MDVTQYYSMIPACTAQVAKGAFLTAGTEVFNPMTIGWALFGEVWGKPVCAVLVRKSRYTYGLMQAAETFTVSFPAAGTMQDALAYCGAHSGRDGDKAAAANLSPLPIADVPGAASGVAGCAAYVACRTVFRTESDLDNMDPALRKRFYGANQALPDGDPHVVYFGEVVGVAER